jgi:hypothetical protein
MLNVHVNTYMIIYTYGERENKTVLVGLSERTTGGRRGNERE